MLPLDETLITIRKKRLLRARAATLLSELASNRAPIDAEPLSWSLLLAVPAWCFWSESQRHRLTLIAGALFIAPAMRLWIDADRIRQATQILGEPIFNAVMASETVPKEARQIAMEELAHLETLFLSAGESVLLSSLESGLQPRLAALLTDGAGAMPQAIAILLANETMVILQALDQQAESSADTEKKKA